MAENTLAQNIEQAIDDFANIKDAIIEKGVDVPEGTPTSQYGQKISEIETGITPAGTLEINSNGEYDVTEYASADVEVPQPSGKITITQNGENIDVADYATADVTVDTYKTEYIDMIYRSMTEVTIPEEVIGIGEYAFTQCHSLETVNLHEGVVTIDQQAFSHCYNLVNIEIPKTCYYIGHYAFKYCSSLTSIVYPPTGTMNIGIFQNCTALTSVYIDKATTSFMADVFDGCIHLTDIYYTGTQAEWESITGLSGAGIRPHATIHYEYTPS